MDQVCTAILVGLNPEAGLSLQLKKSGVRIDPAPGHADTVDVIIVGPDVNNPTETARDLLFACPSAHVVFLVLAAKLRRIASTLPFIPHLASAWTVSVDDDEETIVGAILEAAAASRRRRADATLRHRINESLALNAAATRAADLRKRQIAVAEDYLATLVAQAPDALIAVDFNGTVLAWNERASELLRKPVDEAIGALYSDAIPEWLYPDIHDIIGHAAQGDRIEHRACVVEPPGSSKRVLEISAAPVRDIGGTSSSISITIADVTERRLTEAELRATQQRYLTLVQSLPQLVWTATADGACDYLSQQWVDYTGLPEDRQLGLGWLELVIHPEDRQRTLDAWNAANRRDQEYSVEYRIRGRDGDYRWFKARGMHLKSEAGEGHWFGTSTDIQDIVTARETLARDAQELQRRVEEEVGRRLAAEEQLRQSHKMEAVGQLTGGLAHDFNNILAGIGGSLELMHTRLAQGRVSEVDRYLTGAQGAVRRAANLTQRLLAFSRQQTLDPKPLDINALVSGMLDLINRSVGPEIEVERLGASNLWQTYADFAQLENALLNLCVNARDAMPDGGIIKISTSNHLLDGDAARTIGLPAGEYVSLSVSDTGTGMEPEVVARAFDPFYTTKPVGQGTGLGLSMVYGFAGQSGGTVRIRSQVGCGTTVCIYLPRHLGSVDQGTPEPSGEVHSATRSGLRILLVDDEPLVRMVAAEQLEELGYQVLEAGDAFAALELLEQQEDLAALVTDVGLPRGMNGRQLADAARRMRADLPILFITGYAESAVLNPSHLNRSILVLTKPFTAEALSQKLASLLGSNVLPSRT